MDATLPLQAEARSRSCGSRLTIGLELDRQGRIVRVGCRAQACAIGQSAAHVFASGAVGLTAADLVAARAALARWLDGEGPMPDWGGMGLLAAAKVHRGRHGAILLAWDAALAALASQPSER